MATGACAKAVSVSKGMLMKGVQALPVSASSCTSHDYRLLHARPFLFMLQAALRQQGHPGLAVKLNSGG